VAVKRLAFLVAVAATLAAPAAARADEVFTGIAFGAFAPMQVQVLAGDAVTWTNVSTRDHTVNSDDGVWGSAELRPGERFSHTFDAPGTFGFYCRIHTFMRGEVDVARLLIDEPDTPAAAGRPYPLHGRTALAPQTPVTIQADTGVGYAAVASTQVAADGTFAASVTPPGTGLYRAVAGADASPPITLSVLDRTVHARARRQGRRIVVRVIVTPSSRDATVVLQMRLRDRFGWWPVRRKRLDRFSQLRFRVTRREAATMRAVMTLRDGATPLAVSPVIHIRGLRHAKRRG
jgi:plastocyanin